MGKMIFKIYFKVEGDDVIRYTSIPEMGEGIYNTEVVMTKEIFQECYKKWIESWENNEGERNENSN